MCEIFWNRFGLAIIPSKPIKTENETLMFKICTTILLLISFKQHFRNLSIKNNLTNLLYDVICNFANTKHMLYKSLWIKSCRFINELYNTLYLVDRKVKQLTCWLMLLQQENILSHFISISEFLVVIVSLNFFNQFINS